MPKKMTTMNEEYDCNKSGHIPIYCDSLKTDFCEVCMKVLCKYEEKEDESNGQKS